MNPSKMLEQAKAAPEKQDLEAFVDTIWELRRKGNSYREIAEFLNRRGVKTDHTAVYRLVAEGNPLHGYRDGCVLLGDLEYESRKGRPLRPFRAGLSIAIAKRLQIIPLKNAAPMVAVWCQAQFELNDVPNHDWLKRLCECLNMRWNPAMPGHLQGRYGFELTFEGNLMAMVCNTYNLKKAMYDLGTAVKRTTKFFEQDKEWLRRRQKMLAERDAEILKAVIVPAGKSRACECRESMEWNREYAERLTKEFNSIPMP